MTTESVLLLARSLRNKEDSEMESELESSGTNSEMTTRTGKKYGYMVRRINPKRKCKTGNFSLHTTSKEFENGSGFTLKTHRIFSVHTLPDSLQCRRILASERILIKRVPSWIQTRKRLGERRKCVPGSGS